MSNETQREMTLREWVDRLGPQHFAHREYTALLDEVESERIENAHLREAFVTMEKAYNLAALDLAAARAVLDGAEDVQGMIGMPGRVVVDLDRAALEAWQERERR
jgi:hypothetical protein